VKVVRLEEEGVVRPGRDCKFEVGMRGVELAVIEAEEGKLLNRENGERKKTTKNAPKS
jgi:hypothetical protein